MVTFIDGFEMQIDDWTLYDCDNNHWLFECWHCKNLNASWKRELNIDWVQEVDDKLYAYFEIYIQCPHCAVWNMCATEVNYK